MRIMAAPPVRSLLCRQDPRVPLHWSGCHVALLCCRVKWRLNPDSSQGRVSASVDGNPYAAKRPVLFLRHDSSSPHRQTEHCEDAGLPALRIAKDVGGQEIKLPLAGFLLNRSRGHE
jgi:hypothetical protein